MESAVDTTTKFLGKIPWSMLIGLLVICITVAVVSQVILKVPPFNANGFQNKSASASASAKGNKTEGFYGGVVRGSGHPDCLRTLVNASKVLDIFTPVAGNANYRELQLILSKLACLKKDLMSPAGIVDATRYQAFETAHDREAVAEVAGTCLNRSIPERDLDIIFSTWRNRADMLIRQLCTQAGLTESQSQDAEQLFISAWKDVYEIAKGRCIARPNDAGSDILASSVSPRDPHAYTPPSLENTSEYNGYYSGWMGQI
jgi:hypothetical protein